MVAKLRRWVESCFAKEVYMLVHGQGVIKPNADFLAESAVTINSLPA